MTFIDDTHVDMLTPDGSYQTVELSDQGMMAYRDNISKVAPQLLYATK